MHTHILFNQDLGLYVIVITDELEVDFEEVVATIITRELQDA